MRVPQRRGERGSLKWIQSAVADQATDLIDPILARVNAQSIDWLSPLASDDFAEYRDSAFLDLLRLTHLTTALDCFWPKRGPQWDALGITDRGHVLLVEAKAHVMEICSSASQATALSRGRIVASLDETAAHLTASADRAPWDKHFYQLANRLAHLFFLRRNGIDAYLILVNFIGDAEVSGPNSAREWEAAYQVAWSVMGLSKRHSLSKYIIEVFPSVVRLR